MRHPARLFTYAAAAAALLLGAANAPALAESGSLGEIEFRNHCGACHGARGAGDGPLADLLDVAPQPLTTLAKRNGGKFPLERVYRIVDGRTEVAAHGPREMPVWGGFYSDEAAAIAFPGQQTLAREAYVRMRVLELVYFIQSLQEE